MPVLNLRRSEAQELPRAEGLAPSDRATGEPRSTVPALAPVSSGSPVGSGSAPRHLGVLAEIIPHTLPLLALGFGMTLLAGFAQHPGSSHLTQIIGALLAMGAAFCSARATARNAAWWLAVAGMLGIVVFKGIALTRFGIPAFLLPLPAMLLWGAALSIFAPRDTIEKSARALESLLLSGALVAAAWWVVLSNTAHLASSAILPEINCYLLTAVFAGAAVYLTLVSRDAASSTSRWSAGAFACALACAEIAALAAACIGHKPAFWLDVAPGCAFVGLTAWAAWEALAIPTSAHTAEIPTNTPNTRTRAGISVLLDSTWPSGALLLVAGSSALADAWRTASPHAAQSRSLPGEEWWLVALAALALSRAVLGAGSVGLRVQHLQELEDANARLGASVAEREAQLEALRATSHDLNAGLNPARVLSTGLERAIDMLGAQAGALWLKAGFEIASDEEEGTDPATGLAPLQRELERMAVEQRVLSDLKAGGGGRNRRRLEVTEDAHDVFLSGSNWTLATSRGLEDDDARSALIEAHSILEREGIDGLLHSCEVASSFGWVSAVPLLWNGGLVGVLCVTRQEELVSSDHALIEALGKEIGTALGNAQLFQEANRLADRDAITDLLNHRAMQSQLAAQMSRIQRSGGTLSLVLMDLNNFKFFNDTYGHGAGDRVLRTVAACLREVCRLSDVLGRFGGDEFIAVLPDTDTAGTVEVCSRIAARLQRESYPDPSGRKIPITLAFGAAFFPQDGEATSDLLTRAAQELDEARHGSSHLGAIDEGGSTALRVEHLDSEEAREMRQLKQKGIGGSFGVLDALVTAIDNKDHYTRRHSEDVAHWAALMARKLGWNTEALRDVRVCGLLHDVGKIAVPDAILRKPGRLNDDEFNIMQQHPVFGALIVKDVPNLQDVLGGVRHHHERWDGKGYPDKLEGENIPMLGRLLSVPDCFSAMTTDRPYRKALSWQESMDEIKKGKGTQFDPQMAEAFLDVMAEVLGSGGGKSRKDTVSDETALLAPQVGDYLDATTGGAEDGSAAVGVPRSVADAKTKTA